MTPDTPETGAADRGAERPPITAGTQITVGSVPDTSAPSRERVRLGRDFRWLWSSAATTNLSDGVLLAAGPLLVAHLTDNAAAIAGAAFVEQVPWLLFGLVSGALVDRWDRRRVMIVVNLLRAVLVGALGLAAWTGSLTVVLAYALFFLLGTTETLVDNAGSALVPEIVPKAALPAANSWLMGVMFVGNLMVAPPLGAALFGVAVALPFGVNTALMVAGAVLLFGMRHRSVPTPKAERSSIRAEIVEGMRWAWSHRLLRTMAVSLCLMNILLAATTAVLVVYSAQRLGLDDFGFGLLFAALAVGALLGSVVAPWLRDRFGDSLLIRVGLVIETATHFSLALTTSPWVAGATLLVFGAHGAVLGVVLVSARQRAVPDRLQGRVGGFYQLLIRGGTAVGSLIGGFVAEGFGITVPYWAAGVAMAVLAAAVWRAFGPAAFAEALAMEAAAEEAVRTGDAGADETVAEGAEAAEAPTKG
ncbi:MFS transporter [Actinokineospora enzanensis]|uniref:MFS transporter n=1 Tax=Actinokineospora enzanensis TaxID=155975 RepID=UPI00037A056D|nr:MFS transporter [Actinokineospora enzanensis]